MQNRGPATLQRCLPLLLSSATLHDDMRRPPLTSRSRYHHSRACSCTGNVLLGCERRLCNANAQGHSRHSSAAAHPPRGLMSRDFIKIIPKCGMVQLAQQLEAVVYCCRITLLRVLPWTRTLRPKSEKTRKRRRELREEPNSPKNTFAPQRA